jgi:hypothetical protein
MNKITNAIQLVLVLIIFISIPNILLAECVCTCINGRNQPLCESSMDFPPICPLIICPMEPPSIEPINPPTIPPIGTNECRQEQVLNPDTGRYEWKQVCR